MVEYLLGELGDMKTGCKIKKYDCLLSGERNVLYSHMVSLTRNSFNIALGEKRVRPSKLILTLYKSHEQPYLA